MKIRDFIEKIRTAHRFFIWHSSEYMLDLCRYCSGYSWCEYCRANPSFKTRVKYSMYYPVAYTKFMYYSIKDILSK